MGAPAMKPCERCAGAGCIPRQRRTLADGSPDPADIIGQHKGLCDKCGGSGEVLASPAPAVGRQPGYAADF